MPYFSNRTTASLPMGLGCACSARSAMGDTAVPVATSPAAMLQEHINRFASPAAPADVRFLKATIPVTGVVDMATGINAVLIAQKRAADAFARYHDNTSTDLLNDTNAGFADPVGWTSSHLGDLIVIVSNYADAKGIPKPGSAGAIASLFSSPKGLAIAGGLVIAAYMVLRK